jgi:hypothetical protein
MVAPLVAHAAVEVGKFAIKEGTKAFQGAAGAMVRPSSYKSYAGSEALTGSPQVANYLPYSFGGLEKNAAGVAPPSLGGGRGRGGVVGGGGGPIPSAPDIRRPVIQATHVPGRGFAQPTLPSGPSPNAISGGMRAIGSGGAGVPARLVRGPIINASSRLLRK